MIQSIQTKNHKNFHNFESQKIGLTEIGSSLMRNILQRQKQLMKKYQQQYMPALTLLIVTILLSVKAQAICWGCIVTNCQCCAFLNPYNCQICNIEFYDAGLTCVLCQSSIPNCNTCSSSSDCTACKPNFNLITPTICLPCGLSMANCATCDSTTVCTSCASNIYYLSAPSVCTLCSATISNCNTCASAILCISCKSTKYYLSSPTTCNLCAAPMPNCNTCTSASICTACIDNTYYLSSPSTCTLCSSTIANCVTCTSSVLCTTCIDNTYHLGIPSLCTLCSATIPNCVTCSSSSACIACINSTFHLNTLSKCTLCSTTIANCVTCTSSVLCTACINNTYHLGVPSACTLCSTTIANCIACSSASTCLSCINNTYYLNALSTCTLCSTKMPKCTTCTSATFCLTCLSSYYLSTPTVCTLCSVPIPNCAACTSASLCTSCVNSTYYLDSPSLCKLCSTVIPYCITCTSASICTSCVNNNYILDTPSNCTRCSVLITNCITCSSASVCIACINITYYLSTPPSSCILCSSTMPNCLKCTSSSVCIACVSTIFYLSSQPSSCTLCQSTIPNCLRCSSNNVCTVCVNNSYIVIPAKNGCALCSTFIPSCLTCTSAIACTLCENNTFFNAAVLQCKTCASIITDCLVCASAIVCSQCVNTSLAFSPTLKKCVPCISVLPLCLQCNSSSNICAICTPNISALNTLLKCQLCTVLMSGCLNCISKTQCTLCANNTLYLTPNFICGKCSDANIGCITCLSASTCTLCEVGYFLNNTGLCQLCSQALPNCRQCLPNSICTRCVHSTLFILNSSSSCQPCGDLIPNCYSCASATACNICVDQTFFVNGFQQCQSCSSPISNCQYCSSSNFCLSCTNNSLVFNDSTIQCEPCSKFIQYCQTCVSTTYCTLCYNSPSVILTSIGTCISCTQVIPNCIQCGSSSFCTKCEPTHLLETVPNIACVACFSKMFNCGSCTSDLVCTSCRAGIVVLYGCSPVGGCIEVTPRITTSSMCTACNPLDFYPSPQSGICKCKTGVLAGNICTTIPGCTTAFRNSSGQFCSMCSVAKLFILKNSTCVCKDNLIFYQGVCIDICGDGTSSTNVCDDGNLINGDGCSSTCTLQLNYICKEGSPVTPSVCIYQGMVKLELICIYKGDIPNTAQILFKINPFVSNIEKMNLTQSLNFITYFNLSVISVIYSNKVITAIIAYNEDIQGGPLTAQLQFESRYIRSPNSIISFKINECNSNALVYTQGSQSSSKDLLPQISKFIGYISLLVWIIASYSHRMIGVETINTIQFAAIYFTFAQFYEQNYENLSQIRNTLDLCKSNVVLQQSPSKQTQLLRLNYYPNFTDNTIVVGYLVYTVLFITGIILITQKYLLVFFVAEKQKQNSYKIKLQKIKQVCYDFLIFPTLIGFFMNTLFSAVISSMQGRQKSNFLVQIQSFKMVSLIFMTSIIFFKQLKYIFLNQNVQRIKLRCKKQYVPVYLIFLLVFTLLILLSFEDLIQAKILKITMMIIIGVYSIILFLLKPYTNIIHNIGLFINNSGLIFILATLITQKHDNQLQKKFVLAIYAWIGLVLLWAVVRTIYELKWKDCDAQQKQKQKKINKKQQKVEIQQGLQRYHNQFKMPLSRYFQKSINVLNTEQQAYYKRLFNKKTAEKEIQNTNNYSSQEQPEILELDQISIQKIDDIITK